MPSHFEHMERAGCARPCSAWDLTFGGKCLNCGYIEPPLTPRPTLPQCTATCSDNVRCPLPTESDDGLCWVHHAQAVHAQVSLPSPSSFL